MNDDRIRKTEAFLKERFDTGEFLASHPYDKAYRFEHTYRVANIGGEIARREGFDVTETVIACLLHDIAYCEEFGEDGWIEHGRRGAAIARPFLEELGLPEEQIREICYGIAIHVDDEAGFDGERTPIALTVGDADNIDRFDAYRILERLEDDKYLQMSCGERQKYVKKWLEKLCKLKEMPLATKAAEEMWQERLSLYSTFFKRLAEQIRNSKSIVTE